MEWKPFGGRQPKRCKVKEGVSKECEITIVFYDECHWLKKT